MLALNSYSAFVLEQFVWSVGNICSSTIEHINILFPILYGHLESTCGMLLM